MTEHGPEWLSAGIPKQIEDVEQWIHQQSSARTR
jgi:Xaa-Pro aminopeptidase